MRFGLVIDFLDTPVADDAASLLGYVRRGLEEVRAGLWEDVVRNNSIKPECYEGLIRESDGPLFDPMEFRQNIVEKFTFVLIVKGTSETLPA